MKILSIANERIPSEKANSINIVKMAHSLALGGAKVTLVIPQRKNPIQEDVFAYYGVEKNFDIERISVPETINFGKYGFLWSQFVFSVKIFLNKKWNKNEYSIFTRDIFTSLFLAWRGYKVFHDLHGFPEKSHWFWKYVLKKMDGIICTNHWKMQQCKNTYAIDPKKMIVAPNAFDPNLFLHLRSKKEEREQLGLSFDKPIALYSGHLYDWKGVDTFIAAAEFLPEVDFIVVGGTQKEVDDFTKKHKPCHNVVFLGQKPFLQIPHYLAAADVLVLPNSLRSSNPRLVVYSKCDTSPIKMFEYMASGRPIVASDLPSIREILSEQTAVFFEHDNEKMLAEKIQMVLNDEALAHMIGESAQKEVQQFTWKKRAQKILNFIKI